MKYNYPICLKQVLKSVIYAIILLLIFAIQLKVQRPIRVYFQFLGYLFMLCLFLYKYNLFKNKMKDKKYVSLNSVRCQKMFGMLIICFIAINIFGVLNILIDRRTWDEYLLLWQYALLLVVGGIAVFYPFIVIFGETSYISGSFGLCYEEIKEINEIKKYDIMGTEIIKCEIITKNEKKCMEKFLVEEYIYLCNAIQNNKIQI